MIDLSGFGIDDLLSEINKRANDKRVNINSLIVSLMENIDGIDFFKINLYNITINVNNLFVEFIHKNTSYPKIKCYYKNKNEENNNNHRYIDKTKINGIDFFIEFLKIFDKAEYEIYKQRKQPCYHGYYNTWYGWVTDELWLHEATVQVFPPPI